MIYEATHRGPSRDKIALIEHEDEMLVALFLSEKLFHVLAACALWVTRIKNLHKSSEIKLAEWQMLLCGYAMR